MFTGIVQQKGEVRRIDSTPEGARLQLEVGPLLDRLKVSDSVSVQGTCLTVVHLEGVVASFDVVQETLSRTTLGGLRAGAVVNLEPALRVGDPLGGHFVTGHIDGVGVVRGVRASGKAREMETSLPAELLPYLAEKGSVALDGVSLTVAKVAGSLFRVALVPFTLEETTLGEARVGTRLNVEIDVLARYVGRLLESGSVGRTRRP